MLHALVLLLAAQSGAPCYRDARANSCGIRSTGRSGISYAFFEFAPTSGAGMPSACSTTAPTGAKGETLTFTRTGNATCSKKGLATTGIADGDLVVLSSNVARVEPDADGVLGLRVEGSRANVLVRSDDLGNAAYADVGTPTLTGSQTDPFGTTTATTVEDNDAAAYEGRSQSVTVSAGAAYILSCYLKAGTLTTARLSLDGTACNVSGLSSSTWTRATCADASSSGVSIAVQLLVGNATTDTGTVTWGGCQVEAGAYATSYIPTVAAAVTRNAEVPYFAISGLGAPDPVSVAGSLSAAYGTAAAPAYATIVTLNDAAVSNYFSVYGNTNHNQASSQITQGGAPARTAGTAAGAVWQYARMAASNAATTLDVFHSDRGTTATNSAGSASTWTVGRVYLGILVGQYQPNGIISRVCVDPNPARCR